MISTTHSDKTKTIRQILARDNQYHKWLCFRTDTVLMRRILFIHIQTYISEIWHIREIHSVKMNENLCM